MADDEKKEAVAAKPSPYSLTISVIQDKLLLILHDTKSKRIYQSSFTAKDLHQCGFSDKMVSNLQGISKFIETAKAGHSNLKFAISIEKASAAAKQSKAKPNDEEAEGGVQGVVTANTPQSAQEAKQQKEEEVGVITITKEDDFFGTMSFVMKLKQVPREQSEVNKDLIHDLQTELQQKEERIEQLEQNLVSLQAEAAKKAQTISQLQEHQVGHTMPRGSIVMWSGAQNAIPKGWRLCDGNNGTPDLRNRFIVGAGSQYNVNLAGGNKTHQHAVTVHPHTLTIHEIPQHRHEFYKPVWVHDSNNNDYYICDNSSTSKVLNCGLSGDGNLRTKPVGGGGAHSHSGSSASSSHLPPFYALCFIMKLI